MTDWTDPDEVFDRTSPGMASLAVFIAVLLCATGLVTLVVATVKTVL